jgi:hypothetical protein
MYGTFERCAGLMNREEIAAVMSDELGEQNEVALPTRKNGHLRLGLHRERNGGKE